MKCPQCDHEMDVDLAQEGICDSCGAEFDSSELEEKNVCSECDEEVASDELEDGVCSDCRKKLDKGEEI